MKRHWKWIVGGVVGADRSRARRLVHLRKGDQQGRSCIRRGRRRRQARRGHHVRSPRQRCRRDHGVPHHRRRSGVRDHNGCDAIDDRRRHSSRCASTASWIIAAGSEVGYRVDESISGFDTDGQRPYASDHRHDDRRRHHDHRRRVHGRHDDLQERREPPRRAVQHSRHGCCHLSRRRRSCSRSRSTSERSRPTAARSRQPRPAT